MCHCVVKIMRWVVQIENLVHTDDIRCWYEIAVTSEQSKPKNANTPGLEKGIVFY